MRPVDTVGDLVRLGAQRAPGRCAVKVRDGASRTYAELDERTDRLANALLGAGLEPGDRIATWMEDGLEYVEVYLAAAKAGLVVVPVNARFVAAEAEHLVTDSGARMLIWTKGMAEQVAALDRDLQEIPVGSIYEALVEAGRPTPPTAPDPDALYILGYTSGTTGPPKGAMLTHRSVLAIARLNAISYRLPISSVAALTGSMSFVATVPAHVLAHFYLVGTNVIMGRWDAESLLAAIKAERATFTYLPSPTMREFAALAERRPRDWETVDCFLHSASRADPDTLRALCAVVGDRFVEGWGMTENSGGLITASTAQDIRDDDPRAFETVGRAALETVIAVRGDDGEWLPHDGQSVGELCYRSPALFDGYWNRDDATAEALRDGWFHSSDLGSLDADGYVTIADRRTDLIVSGGMNVYPSEVEDVIAALDGVRECAVVGAPHERWGQTVVAVVVGDATEEAIVERCRERLASYKKPTRIVFAEHLPRTPSLKVKRAEVRAMVTGE